MSRDGRGDFSRMKDRIGDGVEAGQDGPGMGEGTLETAGGRREGMQSGINGNVLVNVWV